MNKQYIGQQAELAALAYLTAQGLQLVAKNYHCRLGEIDLIMQQQDTLVFVEVRLRTHPHFASALESVDRYKQYKLHKTAEFYLQQHRLTDKLPCRFDVVAIHYEAEQACCQWIKNAF